MRVRVHGDCRRHPGRRPRPRPYHVCSACDTTRHGRYSRLFTNGLTDVRCLVFMDDEESGYRRACPASCGGATWGPRAPPRPWVWQPACVPVPSEKGSELSAQLTICCAVQSRKRTDHRCAHGVGGRKVAAPGGDATYTRTLLGGPAAPRSRLGRGHVLLNLRVAHKPP